MARNGVMAAGAARRAYPAARLQERHGGQVRGAEIAARAGDEQGVPKRSLVALGLTRGQGQRIVDANLQAGRRDHGRREGER